MCPSQGTGAGSVHALMSCARTVFRPFAVARAATDSMAEAMQALRPSRASPAVLHPPALIASLTLEMVTKAPAPEALARKSWLRTVFRPLLEARVVASLMCHAARAFIAGSASALVLHPAALMASFTLLFTM